MNPTYPEKRIHTRSMPNVETGRLLARLDWMRDHLTALGRACEQKNDFRAHAREVVNIERELAWRAVTFDPVTNGAHLTAIPVGVVRTILPQSRTEHGDFA